MTYRDTTLQPIESAFIACSLAGGQVSVFLLFLMSLRDRSGWVGLLVLALLVALAISSMFVAYRTAKKFGSANPIEKIFSVCLLIPGVLISLGTVLATLYVLLSGGPGSRDFSQFAVDFLQTIEASATKNP